MKTKSNRKSSDHCQTPFYAIDPLLEYLPKNKVIWESAPGDGHLVYKLTIEGYKVTHSYLDFFKYEPNEWDVQVTNPPYSIKYIWLRRSYELNKPFALLLPLDVLGSIQAQDLFEEYGIPKLLIPNIRINFKMPNKGYIKNGAQFHAVWFTYGLDIENQLNFVYMRPYEDPVILVNNKPYEAYIGLF